MPRPPQEDKVICSSCGFANYYTANFCLECDAPISAHAVNDAFDTIKSQGWAYRKSQETPKLIVVIGNWLIFSPMAICGAGGLLFWLKLLMTGPRGGGGDAVDGLLAYVVFPVVLIGLLYVSTTILYRTTTSYLAAQQRPVKPDDEDDDFEDGGEFDDDFDDEDLDVDDEDEDEDADRR